MSDGYLGIKPPTVSRVPGVDRVDWAPSNEWVRGFDPKPTKHFGDRQQLITTSDLSKRLNLRQSQLQSVSPATLAAVCRVVVPTGHVPSAALKRPTCQKPRELPDTQSSPYETKCNTYLQFTQWKRCRIRKWFHGPFKCYHRPRDFKTRVIGSYSLPVRSSLSWPNVTPRDRDG